MTNDKFEMKDDRCTGLAPAIRSTATLILRRSGLLWYPKPASLHWPIQAKVQKQGFVPTEHLNASQAGPSCFANRRSGWCRFHERNHPAGVLVTQAGEPSGNLARVDVPDTGAGDLAGSNICLSTHRTPAPVAGSAHRPDQFAVNVWNLSGVVVCQRSRPERSITTPV